MKQCKYINFCLLVTISIILVQGEQGKKIFIVKWDFTFLCRIYYFQNFNSLKIYIYGIKNEISNSFFF